VQLFEKNLGPLDPLYLNGGAKALFTSAAQRDSSRIIQQVQNSTLSIVLQIQSALAQARAQSLISISILQNSTSALIGTMSSAVASILADSRLQVSMFVNATNFLLDDVYGDFLELAGYTEVEQSNVLNATSFLVQETSDNTKYSLASAGARCVQIFSSIRDYSTSSSLIFSISYF
jgi:hypothetical protein